MVKRLVSAKRQGAIFIYPSINKKLQVIVISTRNMNTMVNVQKIKCDDTVLKNKTDAI